VYSHFSIDEHRAGPVSRFSKMTIHRAGPVYSLVLLGMSLVCTLTQNGNSSGLEHQGLLFRATFQYNAVWRI